MWVCGIGEPGIWNLESGIWNVGIWNLESGNLECGNLECGNLEYGVWNVEIWECGVWNVEMWEFGKRFCVRFCKSMQANHGLIRTHLNERRTRSENKLLLNCLQHKYM